MNIVIVIEYKENVKKKPHQTELTREIQFQYFKLCVCRSSTAWRCQFIQINKIQLIPKLTRELIILH